MPRRLNDSAFRPRLRLPGSSRNSPIMVSIIGPCTGQAVPPADDEIVFGIVRQFLLALDRQVWADCHAALAPASVGAPPMGDGDVDVVVDAFAPAQSQPDQFGLMLVRAGGLDIESDTIGCSPMLADTQLTLPACDRAVAAGSGNVNYSYRCSSPNSPSCSPVAGTTPWLGRRDAIVRKSSSEKILSTAWRS